MTDEKTLRVPDYLEHILQAMTQIETYTEGIDQAAFARSPLLQDAVVRNIEIIGEAANNILSLDSTFDKNHPDLELRAAYAMRNALSHGYFTVNPVVVWGTVQHDIPTLKKQVVDALRDSTPPLNNGRKLTT
jgi:uncharacterized protein with HEPN domain